MIVLSCFDLKYMKVPNWTLILLTFFVVVFRYFECKDCFLYGVDFSAVIFVALITLPGLMVSVFGAADVKLLLILSFAFSFSQMLNLLFYSFIAFALYWSLFARGQKEAPFVPSILVGMVVTLWVV
ncbi:prepilin peptidase (plasmid) [Photobacterium sp. GJ3]|nr:prepilin peptidase [Photobacterium sp. GJ3]